MNISEENTSHYCVQVINHGSHRVGENKLLILSNRRDASGLYSDKFKKTEQTLPRLKHPSVFLKLHSLQQIIPPTSVTETCPPTIIHSVNRSDMITLTELKVCISHMNSTTCTLDFIPTRFLKEVLIQLDPVF